MKNILCWTSPNKDFSDEVKTLVRIHIDNSYDLGWKKEDILLYTNFRYSYNGISAYVIPDKLQCWFDKTSNKIFVIEYLFGKDRIVPNELYWYHDFDAFQNNAFTEEDVGMGAADLGLTPYGYKAQWNGGSFFFTEKAYDLFQLWRTRLLKVNRTRADEKTITDLTLLQNEIPHERYQGLNVTFNFGMRHTEYNYRHAVKPLKVLHFHPDYNDGLLPHTTKETFMYGKNRLGIPYMTERLIKIFNHHGIS